LRANGPNGVVRFHEFEDFAGIESVSRANHAAVGSTDQRNTESMVIDGGVASGSIGATRTYAAEKGGTLEALAAR
jgi:hypothetical protein